MELKYFALHAKAEPIRMCLWKAGVDYKDTKMPFLKYVMMKRKTKVYGSIVLTLADGTVMSHANPILDYLGTVHGLKPTDLMENYRGEKARQHL